MSKKTVVIGASENPERYAYRATVALKRYNHEVVPVGLKEGEIQGIKILKDQPKIEGVHTVTLYVGPRNQASWIDYVISLKPKRVIFNPGTESGEFEEKLKANNIEPVIACTLVMLSVGNY
ncbi:MAG: CoA-binding protein [Bacteroidota bacterium]|jgi:predicted CoA-binding protein|nr:CoA-binding protein [Bacteroidota bacterium]